jgi:uncharacterized protein
MRSESPKFQNQFMNKIIFLFCLSFTIISASDAQTKNQYDSALAKKLGADQFGMRKYVIVFLKPGPAKITDSVKRKELFEGHMKNIERLANEGKLAIAGPFLDKGPYSGIFIFSVATVEEAKALVDTDPAVKAGVFEMEAHPWYGSAALMQVIDTHGKLQKKGIME